MFIRALFAFLVLPGVAAIMVPAVLGGFDPWRASGFWQGSAVMLLGAVLLLCCVRDFYISGKGTLAPWDPPKRLVVVGLYRYVRNPMYVGVLTLVAGWAIVFASPLLVIYALFLAISFHIQVIVQEEPWLRSQFGNDWSTYCANVGPDWRSADLKRAIWRIGGVSKQAERQKVSP
jgi:protein-S-isoprenylcysteine O-methyltransferase Ste14